MAMDSSGMDPFDRNPSLGDCYAVARAGHGREAGLFFDFAAYANVVRDVRFAPKIGDPGPGKLVFDQDSVSMSFSDISDALRWLHRRGVAGLSGKRDIFPCDKCYAVARAGRGREAGLFFDFAAYANVVRDLKFPPRTGNPCPGKLVFDHDSESKSFPNIASALDWLRGRGVSGL
jgi:hypothetical protein